MPEPYVIISAPVYDRAWILPTWFEAITRQDYPLDRMGFVFEGAPNDEATIQCLMDFSAAHPELKCFDVQINSQVAHKSHPEGHRTWTKDHYAVMAHLRNNILNKVSCLNPDKLFSLDTDILLEDSTTISQLVELTNIYPAVNLLAYMTPTDTQFPSVMDWTIDGRGYRAANHFPIGTLFKAGVIMAAIMMSPGVYKNIRYKWHNQGEDLGWSDEARRKSIDLYCASYIYGSHIMSRAMLENYKLHGDPRKLLLETQLSQGQ